MTIRTRQTSTSGSFEKYDRAFYARFKREIDKDYSVEICNGESVAAFREGQPKKAGVAGGSLNSASLPFQTSVTENLGVFFPSDTNWMTSTTLTEAVETGTIVGTREVSAHEMRFDLSGLTESFHVSIDPSVEGRVLDWGFVAERNGTRAEIVWSSKKFQSVQGKEIPVELEYLCRVVDKGVLGSEDLHKWSLSEVSVEVKRSEIEHQLPKDMILSTFDGRKVGRVFSTGSKVEPVALDYGTETETNRVRMTWFGYLVGTLIGVAIVVRFRGRLKSR